MAKQTEDREDLLRDGAAMPVRGRLFVDAAEVVIGFRPRGQMSLYWGQDPVFQFDETCRLRRVFIDSCRYKAERGRLVRLLKPAESSNHAVGKLRLVTQPISDANESSILQRLSDCLQQMDAAFQSTDLDGGIGEVQSIGVTPAEFVLRVRKWIADRQGAIRVAEEPSA